MTGDGRLLGSAGPPRGGYDHRMSVLRQWRSAPPEWMVVAVAAAVVAMFCFWPLPLHLTDALVTSPLAEGPEHVWRWWVAHEIGVPWGGHFSGVNHPDGLSVHVVDPLHAVLGHALGWWWGGPAAALAVVQVTGVVVSALAGWLLAREVDADGAGRVLGASVGLAVPTVVGAGVDGITEGLGLGWCGLQLALLLRLIRTGHRRDGVGFALAFGCGAWSGPYTLVFSAMLDAVVGLWALRQTRAPLWAGALGGLLASPVIRAAFALVDHGPGGALRAAVERPPAVEAWRGAWREGTDVADLLVPAWLTGGDAAAPATGYLGVVWLGVVAVALVRVHRNNQWRLCWPWLVGAAVAAGLSLGPFVVWKGQVVTVGTAELWAPAAFLEWMPVLGRLSRWYRASAVAVLLLVPVGVHAVRGRAVGVAMLVGMLVVVDARLGSPVPLPVPVTPLLHGDWDRLSGPVVELPAVHPLGVVGATADENLLLQTLHGQPGSGTIDARAGAASDHPGLRLLERVLRVAPPDAGALVESARRQLVASGYRHLLLYETRLPGGSVGRIADHLGPAQELAPGVWAIGLSAPPE